MLSLIVDILGMAKIGAGKMSFARSAVEAAPAVREAVSMLKLLSRRKGLTLALAAPDALPPPWAERRRLVQIVQNRVSNAITFTDEGRIDVTLTVKGATLRITVAETGRGMTEADIERALTPFEQVDSARDATLGAGLGLPLVKALVEQQDGRLALRSAPSRGTTAIIHLPLAQEQP
jgi:signal transduction histidine kinase